MKKLRSLFWFVWGISLLVSLVLFLTKRGKDLELFSPVKKTLDIQGLVSFGYFQFSILDSFVPVLSFSIFLLIFKILRKVRKKNIKKVTLMGHFFLYPVIVGASFLAVVILYKITGDGVFFLFLQLVILLEVLAIFFAGSDPEYKGTIKRGSLQAVLLLLLNMNFYFFIWGMSLGLFFGLLYSLALLTSGLALLGISILLKKAFSFLGERVGSFFL
ncbi:MAG: hypothetical protein PHC89_00800 [Candidatus Pacebacteria bacterium]|nr:hypothetical protein [Candidatus Paceibacterota bacterium]